MLNCLACSAPRDEGDLLAVLRVCRAGDCVTVSVLSDCAYSGNNAGWAVDQLHLSRSAKLTIMIMENHHILTTTRHY